MSQSEHVVSIDEQQIIHGSVGFQSNEVKGEASSVCYLLIREHKCLYSLFSIWKMFRQSEVEAKRLEDNVPGWCLPHMILVGEN